MKNKSHGIKNMEIEEQPREKLIRYGASSLSDSELLAILVRFGTEKADVLTLSAQMLEKSGGLHYLADYSYEELCEFDGNIHFLYPYLQYFLALYLSQAYHTYLLSLNTL